MRNKSSFIALAMTIVAAFFICTVTSCGDEPNKGSQRVGEAIDLGLSVKWASQNVGATSPEGLGGLYGWSDYTGARHTQDGIGIKYVIDSTLVNWSSTFYGGANPPRNICGTDSDIVRQSWGDTWRLPSRSEMQELIDKCKWQATVVNGTACMKVTGPNGNSIILPAAGWRVNSIDKEQQGTALHYWTGNAATAAEALEWKIKSNVPCAAWSLAVGTNGTPALQPSVRSFGLSVRPVK